MSIYIPIEKDGRPAYNKALACEAGFQKLLIVISKTDALKEPGEKVKEYYERFTLWAHRLDVFLKNRVSLDSRLEDYPGGPGVVSANLDILQSTLSRCEYDENRE